MKKSLVICQLALLATVGAILGTQARAQTQPATGAAAATSSQPATASQPARGRGATPARTGAFAPDHNPALPTVFLLGDSTVKNSWDRGTDGLWGWGRPLAAYFDTTKINVDNQALGGTSSVSYQRANWPGVLALVKKGDFVIMQFGTNDNGGVSGRGNGDETTAGTGRNAGSEIHTFGWYMRKYCEDTRAKGATPIICSLVPRRSWAATATPAATAPSAPKMNRADASHGGWAKEAAAQAKVGFIDLNNLIADRYEKVGPDLTTNLFGKNAQGGVDGVHTNWFGAIVAAECVVEGIRKMPDCELNKYLLEKPVLEKLKKPSTDPTPDPSPLPPIPSLNPPAPK